LEGRVVPEQFLTPTGQGTSNGDVSRPSVKKLPENALCLVKILTHQIRVPTGSFSITTQSSPMIF
jgi:hypothetical protein